MLSKVILTEVADLANQYDRPYTLHGNEMVYNAIEDALSSDDVIDIRPKLLSHAVSRGMSYGNSRDELHLANNKHTGRWKDARFRFILEVVIEHPSERTGRTGLRVIVTGYTDTAEIARDGDNFTVPEDLEFYINNIIPLRDRIVEDRYGDKYVESQITDPIQLFSGEAPGRDRRGYVGMRPTDVFKTIQMQRFNGGSDDYHDTRTLITQTMTSRKSNNVRDRYLATLISADAAGRYETAGQVVDVNNKYHQSRESSSSDNCRDPSLVSNEFIDSIITAQQNNELKTRGFFRYSDLIDMTERGTLDGLDDITEIDRMMDNNFDYDSINWGGDDGATLAALTLAREIPPILLDHLIQTMSFVIDNYDLRDGKPEYYVNDDEAGTQYIVDGIDSAHFAESAIRQIVDEVYGPLTRDNRISLVVNCYADTTGMIELNISWDGGREETFRFPAFADNIANPARTRGNAPLIELAKTYDNISKAIINPTIDEELSRGEGHEDHSERGFGSRGLI